MSTFNQSRFVLPLPELVGLAKVISEVSTDTLNGIETTDWSSEELRSAYETLLTAASSNRSTRNGAWVSVSYAKEMFELLELLLARVESGKAPAKRLLRRLCIQFENLPREVSDPESVEDGIWFHLGTIARI